MLQAPSRSNIVACVVTFNRLKHLRHGVDRLLSEPIDDVVVVDNGSTDGSREWLASRAAEEPRLHVVLSETNRGGAGGFEMAMRYAMTELQSTSATQPDWVLLLDDDAAPMPGAVDTFRTLELTPDVGSVAAAVYSPDGKITEMNRPGLSPFGSLRAIATAVTSGRDALHVDDTAYHAESTDIDCASFVGWFVRADLVRGQLGYPNGDFFIYADDQIYSYGIRRLGLRNLFVPAIVFEHDTDSRSNAGVIKPYWKLYFLYRNTVVFYRTISGPYFIPVIAFKLGAWTWRARRYDQPAIYMRLMLRGVWDGLRHDFHRSLADVQSWLARHGSS